MLQPSLHPATVEARCTPRNRFAFGLTARTLILFGLGFLWLIPGYYIPRLIWLMPAWDALILFAALLDGIRLPRPSTIAASRAWLSAPSLGVPVEVELTIRHAN